MWRAPVRLVLIHPSRVLSSIREEHHGGGSAVAGSVNFSSSSVMLRFCACPAVVQVPAVVVVVVDLLARPSGSPLLWFTWCSAFSGPEL